MSLRAAVQLALEEARAALPWLDDEAARSGDGAVASIASLEDLVVWWPRRLADRLIALIR